MLRALLFDFNGVLVDDEAIHHELLLRVAGEEGVALDPEVAWKTAVGRDDRAGLEGIFARAGREISPMLLQRLVARKAMYYRQRVAAEGLRPFPGVVALVREAHGAGLRTGIVTGALRSEVDDALERLGLRGTFATIVAAEDVENGKPAPDGYLKALGELNSRPPLPERLFHPHEVVALEDSPAGLEAAAGAGLYAVGLQSTHGAEALEGADLVVDPDELTLEFLTGALEAGSRLG